MKRTLLRRFAMAWVYLMLLLNVAVIVWCFATWGFIHGWLRVAYIYSPLTATTYLVNFLLASPAIAAHWLEKRSGSL